ncbi:MAG: hypothetical protein NTX84_06765 [Nitrospirae bacterium]|nr:hypothetical protein [Nitrospirota bacterium]
MTRVQHLLSLALLIMLTAACVAPPVPHKQDVVDVMLPAPADRVTTAVIQILTDGGYRIELTADRKLTTSYRVEITGPWDWLLRWRFGTERSRVEATVTPTSDSSARLRLNVMYEGKDGLFARWEDAPTALPQSAQHQLRLIKDALQIL